MPAYTYTETFYSGYGCRFYERFGTAVDTFQLGIFNDEGEIFTSREFAGTSLIGSTKDVWFGGQYSIARFNFPQTVLLANTEGLSLTLGTLQLTFGIQSITC